MIRKGRDIRGGRATSRYRRLRRWTLWIVIACLVVEALYLIVGNLCIRYGLLERAINYQPEADFVSWESAVTYFPGFASFTDFTYRGQTRGGQMYVALARGSARISVTRFLFGTLHITSLNARDLDYRYRDRIDFPCWTRESGEPLPGMPANIDFYPEIPGLQNPPDPKPEDLYPEEEEDRPWTVRISGARIRGDIRVAYNEIRLEGLGRVRGGVTAVLRESSAVDRGRVRTVPARVLFGPRVVTEDLDLTADIRVGPFPAECSEMSEIIVGLSGELKVAGENSRGFNMNAVGLTPLLPGQGVLSIESGTGELEGRLKIS